MKFYNALILNLSFYKYVSVWLVAFLHLYDILAFRRVYNKFFLFLMLASVPQWHVITGPFNCIYNLRCFRCYNYLKNPAHCCNSRIYLRVFANFFCKFKLLLNIVKSWSHWCKAWAKKEMTCQVFLLLIWIQKPTSS